MVKCSVSARINAPEGRIAVMSCMRSWVPCVAERDEEPIVKAIGW